MASHDAKVVLVGEKGVGKTCLCIRYVEGVYRSDMPATIGAAFMTKRMQLNGQLFRLQIWDTAGQERFRAMAPMYYRGASIAIIVFDLGDSESFNEVQIWVRELQEKCGTDDLVLAIAGNKCDMPSESRQITTEKARAYAQTVGAIYYETSAKENIGVDDMFSHLIRNLMATRNKNTKTKSPRAGQSSGSVGLKATEDDQKAKSKCC